LTASVRVIAFLKRLSPISSAVALSRRRRERRGETGSRQRALKNIFNFRDIEESSIMFPTEQKDEPMTTRATAAKVIRAPLPTLLALSRARPDILPTINLSRGRRRYRVRDFARAQAFLAAQAAATEVGRDFAREDPPPLPTGGIMPKRGDPF
jgi:hypothetical protein